MENSYDTAEVRLQRVQMLARHLKISPRKLNKLIQENPYQTGNLTDVLKLDRLDPKAPAKLRGEIHYQKHEEVREDQKLAAEEQRQAINKAVAQGQLQRLQQTAWQ